jgi:hypothetical protein
MADQACIEAPAEARKKMLIWEMVGIPLIFAAGSALHFVFEWTGFWTPIAAIAPVNESVWEHFKLSFWPGLLYAAIEWPFVGRQANNFWVAKSVGLLLMSVTVGVGFYAYTAIWASSLIPNVALLAVGIAVGQWVSYRIAIAGRCRRWIAISALVVLVLLMAVFITFGYVPPRMFLFLDGQTQTYGIPH